MDRWPEIVVTESGAAYPDRVTSGGRINDIDRPRYHGPRFGLVAVDYATQRRTIKASGDWYRRVIAANALVPAQPDPILARDRAVGSRTRDGP